MTHSSFPLYATPAMLNADAYKSGHMAQYPAGMSQIMLNMTPRADKYFSSPMTKDGVIVFGIQRFVKDYLCDHWNKSFFQRPKEEAVGEAVALINGIVFGSPVDRSKIEALHDLGYLPVMVDALPEGTLCPIKVPMLTFSNTKPEFAWVAGYLEDAFSNEIWKATTLATIAFHYKRIFIKWAEKTCDDLSHIPFQGHDFALRGLSGMNDGAFNAVAHLTSFMGTDDFAAVYTAKRTCAEGMEYNEIGSTIPATEHTVMCANIAVEAHKARQKVVAGDFHGSGYTDEELARAEIATFKRLLTEVYPTGLVSIVSDTNNYFDTIERKAAELKAVIEARDGKVVFRPDSGVPFHILCGYKAIHFDDAKKLVMTRLNSNPKYYGTLTVEGAQAIEEDKAWTLPYLDEVVRKAGYELLVWDEGEDGCQTLNLETKEQRWMCVAEIEGTLRVLDRIFGSTINSKGCKVLNPKVGCIYGDSITMETADQILARVADMGFASSNVVFGIGSFTYQFLTRDTFGFAVKGTACQVDEVGFLELSKNPITDGGMKKSAHGCTQVIAGIDGKPRLVDGLDFDGYEQAFEDHKSLLVPLFCESVVLENNFRSLKKIREVVDSQL